MHPKFNGPVKRLLHVIPNPGSASGTGIDMEWKIAPIRNAEGEISHYLAIQKDVSHER